MLFRSGLANLSIELLDELGNAIATTTTDEDGLYEFGGLLPGDYQVRQINESGYGNVTDSVVNVTIVAGETSAGIDFVDELARISGSVLADDDDNNTGDRPLSNVTIELLDDGGDVIATTTTNDRGLYEFSDLLPGEYQVRQVNLSGYSNVTDNAIDVTVGAGETNDGIDFIDELARISGSVLADDDDNDTGDRPLSNVTVELLDENGNVVATTTTDDRGLYEFGDLLPGDYQIRQVNLTGYGDVTDSVVDVTVGTGETSTGSDFVDELGRISGNVRRDDDDNNSGDRPLENITVELLSSDGNVVATTTTNERGMYEFSNLLPGDYQVRQVNESGYGDVTGNVVNVTVGAGETNTGNDFVDELARISGSVLVDDDDNDSGDRPLENVAIELLDDGGDVVATTTTNDRGVYEFSNLLPGDYQVRQVNESGYGDVTGNVVNVTVGAGETNDGVDFVDELARISGSVLADDDDNDSGDRPLENITVELLSSDGNVVATTTTNDRGLYEFSNLLPGDYQVRQVNESGYGDVTDNVVDVIVGAGETNDGVDFVDELGRITGSVLADNDDGTGDSGLANLSVELLDDNSVVLATTATDEDGLYEFINLLPGDYQVRQVNESGYGNITASIVNVTLSAGETNDGINFVNEELGAIAGSVTIDNDNNDSGDAPLEDVTINLFDADGALVASTTTDVDGLYEFTDIASGEYTVEQVNFPGYGDVMDGDTENPSRTTLTLAAGATERVNFVDELGRIKGNVSADDNNDDLGDRNLENVSIELIDANWSSPTSLRDGESASQIGNVIQTTATDADGNYEFSDLLAGDYTVRQTNLDGYGDVNELDSNQTAPLDTEAETRDADNDNLLAVALAPGETDDGNDFVDEELGSLSGNLSQDTTGDGQEDTPSANVILTVLGSNGEFVAQTTTDESGNYRFDNLEPGRYTVVETIPDNLVFVAGEGGSGELSGNLSQDTTGDGQDDTPSANVILTVLGSNGEFVAQTTKIGRAHV